MWKGTLGVLVDEQHAAVAENANRKLDCTNKDATSREVINSLRCSVPARPRLEFWSWLCKRDMDRLERAQRRTRKMSKEMRRLVCKETLRELPLF